MKKYAVFILILFFAVVNAAAYTRITSSSGQMPKWSSMPIPYWINERGSSQISNGSEFQAIHASFQSWQNIETADITFEYKGTTPAGGVAFDGINVVSFSDDSAPLGSSTIAATFSFYRNNGGAIAESDILFNTALEFSTTGESNKLDIQSVLTHEIGHLLGLDHSGLVSSIMVPFAAASQIDQRTLMYDDIAGVSEIYPRTSVSPLAGQIRGFVRVDASTAVFGAHVVAVDREGTAVVSTISQPDGSYTIRFLPSGTYWVYAEPLDLPVGQDHIGGGSISFYRNLKTNFGTTYFGNVSSQTEARTVQVIAGSTASADIQVLPQGTTGLNLTRPAFAPRIARGSRGRLRVGGEDITAGIAITASSPSLTLGTPTFGGRISSVAGTSATMELTVALSAPLGPKNIAVSRGGVTSIVSGTVVITDVPPSNVDLAPEFGSSEGGTPVTITGSDFRPGAQVYFGGLPASGVRIVDSGTIQVTTPRNSPGASVVQVINADGTSGRSSRNFTYTSPPPSIDRVFPLSGPPTTTVTIEGQQFDPRTQNIEVRFNGARARVANATSNSIQTVVPFGATSGPITVSVFGQTVTGPVFTVTPVAPSSNLAGSSYNFIDATAGSGGTNLGFGMNDDAIAFATLPFNFSLFRDIYLAGSRISVATNGWLSLETVSNPEFQNVSLPASSVTRPGGSTGVVPPSLIAPFWDDLIIKSGVSTVSIRTVGTAPNRQFIVQWSKMSILDEEGRDLNASLTFEAILFEGSNDIQFVYQSLSGPRSDGSSATVGAQDLKRAAAIQTGFNQPIVSNGYYVTYRFRDGEYSTLTPDTTPPAKPVVTDGGASTRSRTELAASWMSEDPESGIREFQYAIGRTPGSSEVRAFTSTTQSSVVVTGLSLEVGSTYYFAVRAVNNAGLMSEVGVSDGIRVDPAFQPEVKIIPSAPQGNGEFTGIALLAPAAMSVVMKAIDANGSTVTGSGIRNPTTISLAAGQQYARLISEIFGIRSFDGWIELEASMPGLGVYTATGSWDLRQLDGSVARELFSDFLLLHAGASAVLVNPSTSAADVTITELASGASRSLRIPARAKITTTVSGITRVRSSQALAAIERITSSGKLAIGAPAPMSSPQPVLVFPHGVIGGGYSTTVTLVNVASLAHEVTISFGAASRTFSMEASGTTRVSLADFLQLADSGIQTGSVRVSVRRNPFSSGAVLVGVVDIENAASLVSLSARHSVTEASFAHVAHGDGLFTGLCIATGEGAANVVIDVYPATGGAPKTAAFTVGPNQQIAKLVSELVPTVTTQMGGYIRIRSDQPIWTWELYGSVDVIASAPPL